MRNHMEQKNWLEYYIRKSKKMGLLTYGDYDIDTFVSTGAVVIAFALANTRSSDTVVDLLALPRGFVRKVKTIMNGLCLWDDDHFLTLAMVLLNCASLECDKVDNYSVDAVRVLWESEDLLAQHDELQRLRNGYLPGGLYRVGHLGSPGL